MKDRIIAVRQYREALLADPYRPVYHFALPDDYGNPCDPNGAFFADGVYHLMYLYRNSRTDGFHWGHVSSADLLHWRHHPDALTTEDGDKGCFSGGGFVDEDGTAYLTFMKFPAADAARDRGGIAVACARPPYDRWERIAPIASEACPEKWGARNILKDDRVEHIGCADPSNIWKAGEYYYMLSGNKCVLDQWGRGEQSDPHYRGDWADLYRSKDLKAWEYVHRFYENDHTRPDWPDETEDDMCPSFLPLYDAKENGRPSGKYLLAFISHNHGCQYYVGTLEGEKFVPSDHGRMSWTDNAYFAPEALVDDRGRHILWVWLLDNLPDDFNRFGWSGVYAFPRVLWWEDDMLRMAPAGELDRLQCHHQAFTGLASGDIPIRCGDRFRLNAVIDMAGQQQAGFRVRVSSDSSSYTAVYYDHERSVLVMDATHSGKEGRLIREEAPFALKEGEQLSLDLFVDKSVVEVYANERQAICRRVYPDQPADALGVRLIGDPGAVVSLDAWEMTPANPY